MLIALGPRRRVPSGRTTLSRPSQSTRGESPVIVRVLRRVTWREFPPHGFGDLGDRELACHWAIHQWSQGRSGKGSEAGAGTEQEAKRSYAPSPQSYPTYKDSQANHGIRTARVNVGAVRDSRYNRVPPLTNDPARWQNALVPSAGPRGALARNVSLPWLWSKADNYSCNCLCVGLKKPVAPKRRGARKRMPSGGSVPTFLPSLTTLLNPARTTPASPLRCYGPVTPLTSETTYNLVG